MIKWLIRIIWGDTCQHDWELLKAMTANGLGIAEGGDYLHNSPLEAQKFNVVQLLISGTSAPTFGNTLLAAGVFKLT